MVTAGLLVPVPDAARASTVMVQQFSDGVAALVYSAAPDEPNDLTITVDGSELVVSDQGAAQVTPVLGCSPTASPRVVRCPRAGVRSIAITLADRDDRSRLDDAVYATVEAVTTNGGDGNDTLIGGAGSDNVVGDAGNDVIESGAGDDGVLGGDGDDRVDAGPGDDQAAGDGGRDAIEGSDGNDDLHGGAGDDALRGGPGADKLDVPGAGENAGQAGGDRAVGADNLEGDAGDDVLSGGLEADDPDTLSGGDGSDVVDYARRGASVTVTLDGKANDGAAGEGDDLRDAERIVGGRESDTLIGDGGDNVLDGGPGDDQLDGRGGRDTLEGGVNDSGSDGLLGGDGEDVLRGGPGDDSLDGGAGDDSVAGGGGSDALVGDAGQDQLAGGPGLDALDGGDGADTLYGGDIVLVGADGADDLAGGDGDDVLIAGPGDDRLDGGAGADRMNGEAGTDSVSYETRGAPVAVSFDDLPNDGEPGENDNVASDIERVVGGAVADTLTGDARSNTLDGGSGEDYLVGAPGRDLLLGGTAADVLDARDGVRDDVSCGPSLDLAIVDQVDTVRNCEYADREGARRPSLGRTALARSAGGRVAFRLPAARRSIPLGAAVELPLRSVLDTRAGSVRLATRSRRDGPVQSAAFRGGLFSVVQRRARRPITEIRLRGGDFAACRGGTRGRRTASASRSEPVRRVWGRGKGRYRTRGRYSAGVVRGTTWVTEDRCDGTLTRVVTGTVMVHDFVRRITVAVHAGERYLARAPLTTDRRRGG